MNRLAILMMIAIMTTLAIADPPSNDDCADASAINEVTNMDFSTVEASSDNPGTCLFQGSPDIWYVYTATFTGTAIIKISNVNYNAKYAVYAGDDCSDLSSLLVCTDSHTNPQETFPVTQGNSYLIVIGDSMGMMSGSGQLSINELPEAPANDSCSNAEEINEVTELSFSTISATTDGGGTCMSSSNIWYVYTPTFTGDARVMLDAEYSTMLAVYNGADCSSLPTELGCTADNYLDFAAIAGNQYLIEIGGEESEFGDGLLSISEAPEPPLNDDCTNADNAGTLVSGETVQLTGTTAEATSDCDSLSYSEVWIKFTISDYMHVTIDYCDNSSTVDFPPLSSGYLFIDCPCGEGIYFNNLSMCANMDPSLTWQYLPSGTYYYPIFQTYQLDGGYVVNILGESSSAAPTGACCADDGMTCTNNVTEDSCTNYLNGTWMDEDSDCGEYDEENGWTGCQTEPTGACCLVDGMQCFGDVTEINCEMIMAGTWMGEGSDCGIFDGVTWSGCSNEPITGACCADNGMTCYSDVTQDSCENYLAGTWRGASTDCGEYDEETGWSGCQDEAIGACCYLDGTYCVVTDETDCAYSYQGTWIGEGTDCSDNDESGVADVCEVSDTYEYLPGDANMAAETWPAQTIGGDVTYLVNYFRGLADPCYLDGFYASADATGDCMVVGGDVTYLVNYFRGLADMSYCSDYEPAWPTPSDVPTDAPDGWPNCD